MIYNTLNQFKKYFLYSDEKYKALSLLMGVIVCICIDVVFSALFASWGAGFLAAIIAKDLALMLSSIELFIYLLIGDIAINGLYQYLNSVLCTKWQNWLTKNFLDNYLLLNKNYLRLNRLFKEVDHPEQRIQDDVKLFVQNLTDLVFGLLRSSLSLAVFLGTLWVLGGTISFNIVGLNIVIPGYLVWVSLLLAGVTSIITRFFGTKLPILNNNNIQLEAEFRKEMNEMIKYAESVAIENGHYYYHKSLSKKLEAILNISYEIIHETVKLSAFQNFCNNIPMVLPYLCASPLYFAGKIGIEQFSQIGTAFAEVNTAFSWFVNSYSQIITYRINLTRISELEMVLNQKSGVMQGNIIRQYNEQNYISIINLCINNPDKQDEYFIQGLNLTLPSKRHTLIRGKSGLGKTTLFKILGNTWTLGTGTISFPLQFRKDSFEDDVYFLPQHPVLPHDTLKAALAYPKTSDCYSEQEYTAVLTKVGNIDKYKANLNEVRDWSNELSGGQQQHVSFARALLHKPKWLFLDEATSAIDAASESHLYNLLKTELPNLTIISIAHKESVASFHDRVVTIGSQGVEREVADSPIEYPNSVIAPFIPTFTAKKQICGIDSKNIIPDPVELASGRRLVQKK